ncbi:hypothetical protein HDU98_005784 [Podochytrium sp. JEL0797]|nr:hypothetical protein HDU98_005784 [Podochytrium sp. JEL0797]
MFRNWRNRKQHDNTPATANGAKDLPAKPEGATAAEKKPTSPAAAISAIKPPRSARDPHVSAVARGLRVPLTIWLVGYSTLSMLPKNIFDSVYTPGFFVVGLGRGELAAEPLFMLSGLAAGLQLADATPEGSDLPNIWALVKFMALRMAAIIPPLASVAVAVAVSALSGNDADHSEHFAELFGALTDGAFFLAAPWAFRALRKADRGAAPRLAVGSAIAAGIMSLVSSEILGLHPAAGTTLSHAVLPSLTTSAALIASVPLRFPAFFAGLALAAERERDADGKGPSNLNQTIGVAVSAVLWTSLLAIPPGFGSPGFQAIVSAFRYPAAALASYLAVRPIVAVPFKASMASPWRKKLHEVLTHPTFEIVSTVIFAAELIHREVIKGVFAAAKAAGWINVELTDAKVMTAWGTVVVLSLGVGYGVHKVLQVPAMSFVKKLFEKKRDKLN